MQPLPEYVRHLHYTCRDKKVVKESISSQSRRPHKIRQPMVLKQLAQRIAPILQVIYKVSLRDWSSLWRLVKRLVRRLEACKDHAIVQKER